MIPSVCCSNETSVIFPSFIPSSPHFPVWGGMPIITCPSLAHGTSHFFLLTFPPLFPPSFQHLFLLPHLFSYLSTISFSSLHYSHLSLIFLNSTAVHALLFTYPPEYLLPAFSHPSSPLSLPSFLLSFILAFLVFPFLSHTSFPSAVCALLPSRSLVFAPLAHVRPPFVFTCVSHLFLFPPRLIPSSATYSVCSLSFPSRRWGPHEDLI